MGPKSYDFEGASKIGMTGMGVGEATNFKTGEGEPVPSPSSLYASYASPTPSRIGLVQQKQFPDNFLDGWGDDDDEVELQ